MYVPRSFAIEDRAAVLAFLGRHPFGALLVADEGGGVDVGHGPFLVMDGEPLRLRVHFARANPIIEAALAAKSVSVLFQGPDAYVSASFYAEPAQQVPTWSYAVARLVGRARRLDSREELLAVLDRLVAVHEPEGKGSWHRSLTDPAWLEGLLDAIVALEIEITTVEAKLKVSQNRSPEDRARVARALDARGSPDDRAIAELMRELGVAPREQG
jgi:transcriptional regulator